MTLLRIVRHHPLAAAAVMFAAIALIPTLLRVVVAIGVTAGIGLVVSVAALTAVRGRGSVPAFVSPSSTAVRARVVYVDERLETHRRRGPLCVLTVAARAGEDVGVVELRGRSRRGTVAVGHLIDVRGWRPGRVRRVRRIDNVTLGAPVVCR